MDNKIHDLTMLYLSKNVDDKVSIKDLAHLYVETYQETYDELKNEINELNKEKGVKAVSFD